MADILVTPEAYKKKETDTNKDWQRQCRIILVAGAIYRYSKMYRIFQET